MESSRRDPPKDERFHRLALCEPAADCRAARDVWEGLGGGAMLGHVKCQPTAAREHEHNQRPDGALGIGTRCLGKFSLAITQRRPGDVSPWSMMSVAIRPSGIYARGVGRGRAALGASVRGRPAESQTFKRRQYKLRSTDAGGDGLSRR
jgi:hypothetical protein